MVSSCACRGVGECTCAGSSRSDVVTRCTACGRIRAEVENFLVFIIEANSNYQTTTRAATDTPSTRQASPLASEHAKRQQLDARQKQLPPFDACSATSAQRGCAHKVAAQFLRFAPSERHKGAAESSISDQRRAPYSDEECATADCSSYCCAGCASSFCARYSSKCSVFQEPMLTSAANYTE